MDNSPSVPARRRLALVTGASSGIGYALAAQFAQHDFDLIIVSHTDAIQKAAAQLQATGCSVRAVQCDLSMFEGVERLWEEIAATGRVLDAAAINAGVGVGGRFVETDLQEEIGMINLNVVSTVHLAKRVARHWVERGHPGRILFTSSVAATMPGPYLTVYSATKAFVQSLALGLRYELAEYGISVTALQPGPTDTDFFRRAHMLDTRVGVMEKDDPVQVARQGFEALMDGEETVIAGSLWSRLGNAANDLMPESMKAKKHARMARPGSAASG